MSYKSTLNMVLKQSTLVEGVDLDDNYTYTFDALVNEGDRNGFIEMIVTAGRLENYRRNPVILWAHDSRSVPIGRGEPYYEDGILKITITLDQNDNFARLVKSKIDQGMINAVSIGFGWEDGDLVRDEEGNLYLIGWELYECSVVSVPADPDALIEGRSLGLKETDLSAIHAKLDEAEKALAEIEDVEVVEEVEVEVESEQVIELTAIVEALKDTVLLLQEELEDERSVRSTEISKLAKNIASGSKSNVRTVKQAKKFIESLK